MDIYIIHSVGLTNKAIRYGKELQNQGKLVYIPGKQTKKYDTTANCFLKEKEIIGQNIDAIKGCKEIHFMWDGTSIEPVFELGVAVALEKKIVILPRPPRPIDRFIKESTEPKKGN